MNATTDRAASLGNRPAIRAVLGGEYSLSDGRVFWMDQLAVDEIMRRLEPFEFRVKSS